jgi:hypothetical protein
LSNDGKWRSFPKVPHLLQYVISGNCFGKVKINGKTIRQSLQTTVWSTAQLKLNAFLKEHRENRSKVDLPNFSATAGQFKQELENDTSIKPRRKEHRNTCLLKIQETWPELWSWRLDEITPKACKEWAAKLNDKIASNYFNNAIGTLRQITDLGIRTHKKNGGAAFENPASELKRVTVKQKGLQLPEPSQFKELVPTSVKIAAAGAGERTI